MNSETKHNWIGAVAWKRKCLFKSVLPEFLTSYTKSLSQIWLRTCPSPVSDHRPVADKGRSRELMHRSHLIRASTIPARTVGGGRCENKDIFSRNILVNGPESERWMVINVCAISSAAWSSFKFDCCKIKILSNAFLDHFSSLQFMTNIDFTYIEYLKMPALFKFAVENSNKFNYKCIEQSLSKFALRANKTRTYTFWVMDGMTDVGKYYEYYQIHKT